MEATTITFQAGQGFPYIPYPTFSTGPNNNSRVFFRPAGGRFFRRQRCGKDGVEKEVVLTAEEKEKRRKLVDMMECLEREAAIMGDDGGKEADDYNRRAQIFENSSKLFQALHDEEKEEEEEITPHPKEEEEKDFT